MIELKNIKKYYKMGDNIVKALDDVSLTINDGEFVTIIGPSGSGKSTLMNIVGCLDKATSGEYYIDGVEISKYSENQLAFLRNKKMGFIFQGFNLLQNLSAYENVELPLIYQGLSKSERKARAVNSLFLVGMNQRMKHKPSELSGGQQQRVAIARALATKPMCILADEPTGNLDSVTGDEIMAILNKLNLAGTTVIIITHNDEIAKLSRRVVRIHDGKIESDVINEQIASYGVASEKKSEETSSEESQKDLPQTAESETANDEAGEQNSPEISRENTDEEFSSVNDAPEEVPQRKPRGYTKKTQQPENKIVIKSKKNSKKEED